VETGCVGILTQVFCKSIRRLSTPSMICPIIAPWFSKSLKPTVCGRALFEAVIELVYSSVCSLIRAVPWTACLEALEFFTHLSLHLPHLNANEGTISLVVLFQTLQQQKVGVAIATKPAVFVCQFAGCSVAQHGVF